MDMATELRSATIYDVDEAAGLHVRAWRAEGARHVPRWIAAHNTMERRHRQWVQVLEQSRVVAYCLEERGRPVGIAAAELPSETQPEAEFRGLYVDPSRWGRGLGSQLHDAILDRLRTGGVNRTALWVLAGNRRAREFYELRGWELQRLHTDARGVEKARYRLRVG
jgi:GNAT superfamily N-acetyltransferase